MGGDRLRLGNNVLEISSKLARLHRFGFLLTRSRTHRCLHFPQPIKTEDSSLRIGLLHQGPGQSLQKSGCSEHSARRNSAKSAVTQQICGSLLAISNITTATKPGTQFVVRGFIPVGSRSGPKKLNMTHKQNPLPKLKQRIFLHCDRRSKPSQNP